MPRLKAQTAIMSGSPVDWSEFHVWNFRLQDLEKLKQKELAELTGRQKASLGQRAFTLAGSSLSSASKLTKDRFQSGILSQWETWKAAHTDGTKKQKLVTAKYTPAACGAIAGCTATYLTHWLDTVKVRMQTLPEVYTKAGPVYCLRDTIRHEGFRGLYQGAVPAVMGQTARTAVVFCSYELCEEMVCSLSGQTHFYKLTLWQHACAGAMTGVVASFVLCPLELIKCRMQALQEVSRHVRSKRKRPLKATFSSFSMVREIFKVEGVRGLYRGLPGIWVKDVPGSFIYFGSYEAAKNLARSMAGTNHLNSRTVFVCGVFAGLCFCVTHPIESVKTRVQVMSAVSETGGFLQTAIHILKSEGLRPLCSGLKASAARACLYSGIQLVTYETLRDYFITDQ